MENSWEDRFPGLLTWFVHSRVAYGGVVFQEAETRKNGKLKAIHVRLPEGYERGQLNRAADQMAKAALHLAGLLNAVGWG